VELTGDGKAVIHSGFIRSIPSHPDDFEPYAHEFLRKGMIEIAKIGMKKVGVSQADADILASQVAAAVMAHYRGDEKEPAVILDTSKASWFGAFMISFRMNFLKGLYNDLPPADNDVIIDLF
jgi:hypothetical protein